MARETRWWIGRLSPSQRLATNGRTIASGAEARDGSGRSIQRRSPGPKRLSSRIRAPFQVIEIEPKGSLGSVVRALAISDEEVPSLRAGRAAELGVDLVIAAGDLPLDYLGAVIDWADRPGVLVPGNHDPDLSEFSERAGLRLWAGRPGERPGPAGYVDADGHVVDVAGVRVAGLGGCLRYRPGPNQWSEGEQARRARRLVRIARRLRRRDGRGVDILLTHAPPRHCGDGEDAPHHGFECLHAAVAALQPRFLVHGPGDVLEEESVRSGAECPVDVLIQIEGREHEHRQLGESRLAQAAGRRDAVNHGHPDIHQDHVRRGPPDHLHDVPAIGGFTHHLDVGLRGKDHAEAFADQFLVVDQQHADHRQSAPGRVAHTRKPPSRGFSTTTLPP